MGSESFSYKFKARNLDGELVEGLVTASSLEAARADISNQDLYVIDIDQQSVVTHRLNQLSDRLSFGRTKISFDEMILFNHQLQITYSAGLPLLTSLQIIEEEVDNRHLQKAIHEMANDISAGASLSESLDKHTDFLDPAALQLIQAGEVSGKLDYFLEQIIIMIEMKNSNEEKFKSAMLYPKILVGISGLVFLVIFGFVMPKLKELFSQVNQELPMITQVVVGISDFIVANWLYLAASGFILYYGSKKYFSTESGAYKLDKFMLKVPFIGTLITLIEVSTFSNVLKTLLDSGIPALDAIQLSSGTINNRVIKEEISNSSEALEKGGSFAEAFSNSKTIPKFVLNFIRIGEEAGKLTLILDRVSKYYKIQIDRKMNTLGKVIEPAMMVIMFVMVFIIILAVYLPIWKMNDFI